MVTTGLGITRQALPSAAASCSALCSVSRAAAMEPKVGNRSLGRQPKCSSNTAVFASARTCTNVQRREAQNRHTRQPCFLH